MTQKVTAIPTTVHEAPGQIAQEGTRMAGDVIRHMIILSDIFYFKIF